jgi:hypothetical protein
MIRTMVIVLLLASCQSQDRQWSDLAIAMEAQPRK